MIFVDGKPEEVIETFLVDDNSDSNLHFPRILAESPGEVCLGYNEQVDIIEGDVNVDSL